ncbi:response regulator transcription factor [Halovulum sp. GXIMD14794]
MRLLIAEDDPLHRAFLRTSAEAVLGGPETEICEARDGAIAKALFDDAPFDAVILDLQMPGATGVDAARHIWGRRPGTRILFWSNYAEEAYVRGITRIVPEEAVYGYVLKSAAEDRLATAIRGVFEQDQCIVDREVRGVQRRSRDRWQGLTEQEFEALTDLALGLTDRAIAARRKVSLRTAQVRLQNVYAKLGLDRAEIPEGSWGPSFNSRSRTISLAFQRGLLNADVLKREDEALADWLRRAGIELPD